jgi:hypothetical protein
MLNRTMSFDELENAKIGVEATAYLQHMIEEPPAHEPLLAALGGEPIALKQHIERELDKWASYRMTPVFVFEGQSTVGKDDVALANAKAALRKTKDAWELYSDGEPGDAVKTFGSSRKISAFSIDEQDTDTQQARYEHKIYIESYRRFSSNVIWISSLHPLVLALR